MYQGGDVCEPLFRRHDDLKEYVAECESFLKNGQEVPDSKTKSMTWVAFFLVYSRASRRDALRVRHRMRNEVRAYMDEF